MKWAGGKRWLVSRFPQFFPVQFNRYFEPFLGSGAVFFWLRPTSGGAISDLNDELVLAYQQIRKNPSKIVTLLRKHQQRHDDDHYYMVRDSKPRAEPSRAARLIYLNRSCWNGLYRVNQLGQFNVPRGTKNLIVSEEDDFESIAKALRRIAIRCCDFSSTIDMAGDGDFVFVDPPYTVKHNFNGFAKYNERIFNWEDQIRLVKAVGQAADRGAMVLVTNADHDSVRKLYRDLGTIHALPRASIISGKNHGRGRTTEIAVTINYEPEDA